MDHPGETMKVVIAHRRVGGRPCRNRSLSSSAARPAGRSTPICDTFVPGEDGLPSATDRGVPEAILMAVGSSPSKAERDGFAGLLDAWDTDLAGSEQSPFSSGSQAERERTLLGWADSPEVGARAGFQALRKGILLSYYSLPHLGEGPNPVDEALGYPGPLGPPEDPPPKTIVPEEVTADTELECDVVVVGSGAGGGTAAGVLASAGLDVVVLEAGGYYSEEDFDGAELSGYARLYLNGGGIATENQSIGLLAGSCLGGGTVVNYTWCFRPPDHVREDWKRDFGLSDWAGQDFDDSLDAVWERIGISSESSIPSERDHAMRRGLDELGWHSEVMQRNCKGCKEEVCRLCHYGCQIGAKQSTMKTWLQDAYDNGARIVVNTAVDTLHRGGRQGGRREGAHARRPRGDRAGARGGARRGRDPHAGDHAALGTRRPGGGQEPAAPPRAHHVGDLRGGGAALGGHARRDLLGRAAPHERGLRHQVRAGRQPAQPARRLRPLARRARERGADAVAALHGRLRRGPAGARRR